MVRTTWEQALWLNGASEQKVGVNGMDGVEWMGDTPQTVMTTRAPRVLMYNFLK